MILDERVPCLTCTVISAPRSQWYEASLAAVVWDFVGLSLPFALHAWFIDQDVVNSEGPAFGKERDKGI